MPAPPRLALVTAASGPDPSIASLAMLAGLAEFRLRVQHFRSWARPVESRLVGQFSGVPGRHLDAWLMPAEVCRAVFARGAREADLSIVEGSVEGTLPPQALGYVPAGLFDRPGPLGPIAEALDLPRVAVVDCRGWDGRHLPYIPPDIDGLLLDHLPDARAFESLRSLVGLLARRPVIGGVEALPQVRAALAEIPADDPVPAELISPLAASFRRFLDRPALTALASSRPWPADDPETLLDPAERRPCCASFRVAYAMDDAFGGYFPDTLEALAALGANLVEFSPLSDGCLPANVDLVMIGCGCPDRHAERLAGNLSLIAELRHHVCQGHRIYSEGGGTAYLARTMVLGDRVVPGAGILPVTAVFQGDSIGPTPVERRLTRGSWLGPRGTLVRGYRSGRWNLQPAPEIDDCPAASGSLTTERDVYFRKNAVGSLVHLHLGALPEAITCFAGARTDALARREPGH